MKSCTFSAATRALAGMGTAIVGTAVLEQSFHTWPTILIVIGVYAAASGIRGLRLLASYNSIRRTAMTLRTCEHGPQFAFGKKCVSQL